MDLHIIKRITFFLNNPRIDSFHFTMFHGWAVRDGQDQDLSYGLGDRLELPLKLYVNTFRANDIIQPRLNLLVRPEIADRVGRHRNVELLKCVTQGVCEIPYAEGDFSHWEMPGYADDGERPKKMLLDAARPPGRGEATTFYELICPDLERIPGAARGRKVTVNFPSIRADLKFPAKNGIFEEFPIVWYRRLLSTFADTI